MVQLEKHENSAVVFVDMSGSTKLYVAIGDERAREVVARTLEQWSALTAEGGGTPLPMKKGRHSVPSLV